MFCICVVYTVRVYPYPYSYTALHVCMYRTHFVVEMNEKAKEFLFVSSWNLCVRVNTCYLTEMGVYT